ncbi:MAG: hypothetical protein QOK10_3118 [Pseudonocardiales bacterium]|jgi:uncharacterized protein|nr:hypothetical protein [Pseudonocardiales bacterium]
MKTPRRLGALSVALLGLTAAAALCASDASAHVTVAAPEVSAGASDATITFRVPDESAKASTVGLKIQLPTDHPIAGVLVAPMPGWSATIKRTKLATPVKTDDGDITEVVSEIDWTAGSGAGIEPGYFGQFTIIAGKLPDGVTSLTFKAIQTYSDRSTVSWIEEAAPGSTAEPEHPAPTVQLSPGTGPSGASAGSASPSSPAPSVAASSATANGASKGAANTGIILGGIGVILGGAALAVALVGRRRDGGGRRS